MSKMVSDLTAERIGEALFLFGLGVVAATDSWWPGLIIDFGVAYAVWLALHGRYWAGAVVSVFVALAPTMYVVSPDSTSLVPVVFLGLGASGLVRAFVLRSE
jgi:hypothetical protein